MTKVILGRRSDDPVISKIIENFVKQTQGLWDEFCVRAGSNNLQVMNEEEPNFALQSIGASIVHTEDEPLNLIGFLDKLVRIKYRSNHPDMVLNPSMELGNCYAFKGHKASFTIRLSHKILIRSVTIEHIHESMSLTGDISNAPKDFYVYGVEDSNNDEDILLGSFRYNNSKTKRAQTFYLDNDQSFQLSKIVIASNYGNPKYTCIYRVAVHGKF